MAADPYSAFSLHSPTCLHQTDTNFSFDLAWDNDDMVVIRRKSGSNKTEIHIIDAASSYTRYNCQVATGLHTTDENWEFLIAPNRDLVCINRKGGSGQTEVHILSKASNYQNFVLHIATGLHNTLNRVWSFSLAENRDLFCVANPAHKGGCVSVVVLSAASQYKEITTNVNGGPGDPGSHWIWKVGRSDRDLYGVKMRENCTEVHVWGEKTNYRDAVLHTGTAVPPARADKDVFAFSKSRKLFLFKRDGGSNSTEIHALPAFSFSLCPKEPLPHSEKATKAVVATTDVLVLKPHEYAMLSEWIYDPKKKDLLPRGCTVTGTTEEVDVLYGRVCVDREGSTRFHVLCIRGSEVLQNWVKDAEIALKDHFGLGGKDRVYDGARRAFKRLGECQVATGHSLGGLLCEKIDIRFAVTFNGYKTTESKKRIAFRALGDLAMVSSGFADVWIQPHTAHTHGITEMRKGLKHQDVKWPKKAKTATTGWSQGRHVGWEKQMGADVYSHTEIKEGSYLECDGYKAVIQGDGNFVLYNRSQKAIWSSRTPGKGKSPFFLAVQSDGNLVMYDGNRKPTWSTKTCGKGKAPNRLVLQSDHNLVLYDSTGKALWATGTNGK